MIGLIYLLVMGGHLLLSIWLVIIAINSARKAGKPGWRYGVPVGFLMFSLLYWDLIPTLAIHRFYCISEGGSTINKTLERWKQENPGVAETLVANKGVEFSTESNRERYILNQRFAWDIHTSKHIFGVRGRDERIVDMNNGDLLARYVDFDTDIRALGLGPRNFRDLRIWLAVDSCEVTSEKPKEREFYRFKYLVKYQKEYK